jgi:hypothetical protein
VHQNRALQADWSLHGEAAFEFRVLAHAAGKELRRSIEQSYLDYAFGTGLTYNRNPDSRGGRGLKFTDAQRRTLSAVLKGKPKSEAHREALSDAAKRRWASVGAEDRQSLMSEMGRGNQGKPKSLEHRRNISRGRPKKLTEEQVREIKRRIADGESMSGIAREHGVSPSLISNIHRGKAWTHLDAA